MVIACVLVVVLLILSCSSHRAVLSTLCSHTTGTYQARTANAGPSGHAVDGGSVASSAAGAQRHISRCQGWSARRSAKRVDPSEAGLTDGVAVCGIEIGGESGISANNRRSSPPRPSTQHRVTPFHHALSDGRHPLRKRNARLKLMGGSSMAGWRRLQEATRGSRFRRRWRCQPDQGLALACCLRTRRRRRRVRGRS